MDSLKLTWLDAGLWLDLFREAGIRSPVRTLPCTPGDMRKWLRKIDVPAAQVCEYTGFRSLTEYQKKNPSLPLFAFLGIILEAKREGMLSESIDTPSVPAQNCVETTNESELVPA
jgi:hypothetical protein